MTHGIVAAGHEKTGEAAAQILKQGGNAFDAIVAAGFAACVAEPVLTSLGGGGFLLAHNSNGLEQLYDFFVQTPRKKPDPASLDFHPITADFGKTTQEFHIGLGSIATPGMIAGLFEVHQDLGCLPILEVMAPAVTLCREGIRINPFQEYLFSVVEPINFCTPESKKIFSSPQKPGQRVRAGDVLKFPDLAQTLEALAREGALLFYEGDLAHRLVTQCREGGALTLEDLASYQVVKREPLEFFYQGRRIITNPPPSCGGILIAFAFGLLEELKLASRKFGSVEELFQLARVMELTNKARLDALNHGSDWFHASQTLLEEKFLEQYRRQIAGRPAALRGTTHLNVIDAKGNVASMSMTNGEGCGHILKGTGIMLNNMLGEEDLNPEGFQAWPVHQRLSSMMAPTLLFDPDGKVVAMGSGGSNRLRTAIVQVLRNLIDHKMAISEAVHAPRIHYERGLLSVEPGFAPDVIRGLCEEFPEHHLWEDKNLFFGGVHTVGFKPKEFHGAGDPRRFGVCLKI